MPDTSPAKRIKSLRLARSARRRETWALIIAAILRPALKTVEYVAGAAIVGILKTYKKSDINFVIHVHFFTSGEMDGSCIFVNIYRFYLSDSMQIFLSYTTFSKSAILVFIVINTIIVILIILMCTAQVYSIIAKSEHNLHQKKSKIVLKGFRCQYTNDILKLAERDIWPHRIDQNPDV